MLRVRKRLHTHMQQRATTIEDVAQAAGVSAATVSRALRELPNVASATRERVRRCADEMHYRPDPIAAALAAGRTHTVGMAVPLLGGWYFSQVMSGAETVLSAAGYDLLLFTVDSDSRRQRVLTGPLLKRADGLILVDVLLPSDEATRLMSGGVKVVSVGLEVEGASSVVVDDFQIAYDAVTHLIELGHRDIALVQGEPHDTMGFSVPGERRRGYRAALADVGVVARQGYEVAGNFSVEGGREAMARLMSLDRPPSAVFAMSDEMAFGALRHVWDRGMRTPDDISIVGVDDHELAEVIGLTTIQQAVAEHGAVAAGFLINHLADDELDAVRHTSVSKLILRETTGPPKR